MKVLVTGASGMIGSAVARALTAAGHEVIAAGRREVPGTSFLPMDFATTPSANWWAEKLVGVNAVINAVGILRESPSQRFEALHDRAPVELFRGCERAGIRRVVQISALGADADARSNYHLSKRAADEALRALPLSSAIVAPSLVFAPGGASAGLFTRLAVLPVVALPATDPVLQPVHLDDVVEGIVRLVNDATPGSRTIAFTGSEPMPLTGYLARLRSALGLRTPQRTLRLPDWLCIAAARVAGSVPGSMIDEAGVRMLLRGNAASVGPFAALLGRSPRDVEQFIGPAHASAAREAAVLDWAVPALRCSVAAMWIWTAFVSAGLYPTQGSLQLLADFGIRGTAAWVALYAGALLDLCLGVACLVVRGRTARAVWAAQLAVIAAYTLMISLRIPEWWLHPFGPLSKNLPLMVAIGLLWALEKRR